VLRRNVHNALCWARARVPHTQYFAACHPCRVLVLCHYKPSAKVADEPETAPSCRKEPLSHVPHVLVVALYCYTLMQFVYNVYCVFWAQDALVLTIEVSSYISWSDLQHASDKKYNVSSEKVHPFTIHVELRKFSHCCCINPRTSSFWRLCAVSYCAAISLCVCCYFVVHMQLPYGFEGNEECFFPQLMCDERKLRYCLSLEFFALHSFAYESTDLNTLLISACLVLHAGLNLLVIVLPGSARLRFTLPRCMLYLIPMQ